MKKNSGGAGNYKRVCLKNPVTGKLTTVSIDLVLITSFIHYYQVDNEGDVESAVRSFAKNWDGKGKFSAFIQVEIRSWIDGEIKRRDELRSKKCA